VLESPGSLVLLAAYVDCIDQRKQNRASLHRGTEQGWRSSVTSCLLKAASHSIGGTTKIQSR
jgi:hypothetical protein